MARPEPKVCSQKCGKGVVAAFALMWSVVMDDAGDCAGEEMPRQRVRTAEPTDSRRREVKFIERSGDSGLGAERWLRPRKIRSLIALEILSGGPRRRWWLCRSWRPGCSPPGRSCRSE